MGVGVGSDVCVEVGVGSDVCVGVGVVGVEPNKSDKFAIMLCLQILCD